MKGNAGYITLNKQYLGTQCQLR